MAAVNCHRVEVSTSRVRTRFSFDPKKSVNRIPQACRDRVNRIDRERRARVTFSIAAVVGRVVRLLLLPPRRATSDQFTCGSLVCCSVRLCRRNRRDNTIFNGDDDHDNQQYRTRTRTRRLKSWTE